MGKKEQKSQGGKTFSEKVLGKLFGLCCRVVYGCSTDRESKKNLGLLRKHLKKGQAVVYFNHIAFSDGPVVYGTLIDRLGGSSTIIGGPASQKHYDENREKSPLSLIMRLAPAIGIQLNPVVQHYDRESYSGAINTGLLRSFILQSKEILRKKGGVLVIAPEGTRSPDGTLQESEQGVEHCDHYGPSVIFCPLAIVPKGEFNRGLNFGRRFRIIVGSPFLKDILVNEVVREGDSMTDTMMRRLAGLLPEKMRGYYR